MYNVYGVLCSTRAEAEEVAGLDSLEQLEAESAWRASIAAVEHQDRMEAAGGPVYRFDTDRIPF